MRVLDIQRRSYQAGRIRIGQQVQAKNGRTRPVRLDTFRITTQSRHSADAIAAIYGGTVQEWRGEFEVITERSELGVTVPPRDQVISQAYEMWTAGGCQRRCNSQHEQISNGPCLCPHAKNPADEDEVERCALERAKLAAQNPPKACKLVTRLSVMLPDLPGLGVWRLDTGSFYAGVEITDAAALMELARAKGVFLPAILRIDHRTRISRGETKKYPVPVLEVLATFRQIASGELEAGGITAQLPPAPGEPVKAITAGPPDLPRSDAGPNAAPTPSPPGGEREPAGPGQPEPAGFDSAADAETYAARGRAATTADELKSVAADATEAGVMGEYVCYDAEQDAWEPLDEYLRRLWAEKGQAQS